MTSAVALNRPFQYSFQPCSVVPALDPTLPLPPLAWHPLSASSPQLGASCHPHSRRGLRAPPNVLSGAKGERGPRVPGPAHYQPLAHMVPPPAPPASADNGSPERRNGGRRETSALARQTLALAPLSRWGSRCKMSSPVSGCEYPCI
ncbi:hypothetical protein AGOR_G00231420 [Albula goreensis]|uniref:Uncharacterized protein n=1 Tax=Albula goreensis TaxID=1534307 RepID=A0A8T3CL11_9TELE|nr:hypothetical protein AGOR_G00231420 [Albula goreensis]